MAFYIEINVSLSAINGLTWRRAEIPDVIFLHMFSVLGLQDKCKLINYCS